MRSLNVPIFILTAATAASAHAGITSTWIGSSGGVWSSGANWSSGVPGTGGVTDAVITTGRGLITVNLDSFPVIQTLTIGSGCTLLQPDNRDMTVTGVLNDGFWSLGSAGSATDIALSADMGFLGSGTIELGNSSANRILSVGAVRTLLNGANHTIRGAGQVGFNNTQITNDGVIEATLPVGMWVDQHNGTSLDNNGLMRARDGSLLSLYDSPIDNVNGVIRAEDASFVTFRFGSVTGGTIEATGSGELRVTSEIGQFSDLTKNGVLRQTDNADCYVGGTIVNKGPWILESLGSFTDIGLNSPIVTFAGNGSIEMGNSGNNRVLSIAASRTLVNSAGHTIRGAGQVGYNNTAIENDGLIEATLPVGLTIDEQDTVALKNNSLLRARDGSTLTFYGSPIDNANGVIRAEDASFVTFRYGSVTGGTIEATGSGELRVTSEVGQLTDLTKNGILRQTDNADCYVGGTIVNNGPWYLESAGSFTDVGLNSPTVTFAGSGSLELGNSGNNRVLSIAASRTLVNSAGHTIRGAGQVGYNNTAIENNGLIEATLPVGLTIDELDTVALKNNSLLRARDGSTLTFYGSPIDNANGVIRAEDASFVTFRYGSVSGGTIETTGSGELRVTSEVGQLTDLTKNGILRQADNADCYVGGTIVNNGPWYLESAGSFTDIGLNSPTVTFAGNGSLELGNSGNNRVLSVGAVRTLVNSAGHTIRGAGQVGFNNTVIHNSGLIEADKTTTLTIDPNDGGNNYSDGTMRVSGSGGMNIAFGAWENRGLMDVDASCLLSRSGTYVQTDGETRVDGIMTITSGSYTQSGGLLSGDGTVNSAVSIQGGSASPSNADGSPIGSLSIGGNYSQGSNGGYVVDLGLAGNDVLAVSGNAALGGALQVRLVAPFLPLPGQEFTILTAANINGVFGCVKFPNAGAGYFHLVYSPTSVKLVVDNFATTGADLNLRTSTGTGR